MNQLELHLCRWLLPRLFHKMCESIIPRSGEKGEKVNCFVVAIDKDTSPYLLVDGLKGDQLICRKWDGNSYSINELINIKQINSNAIYITHYYGLSEVKYFGLRDFLIYHFTLLPYLKIRIFRVIQNVDQYFFNKKKLVTKQRIDLLKFMVERSHEKPGTVGVLELMTDLYSIKWVLHPDNELQKQKLGLYLASLVSSEDLEMKQHGYVVKGHAITTIENYEEEERKHSENVKIQRKIMWLTLVIALLALVQTGLITLPVLVDFSNISP